MLPISAFKTALVDALLADAGCAARLGSRIYDETPMDLRGDAADLTASPWAYLGPIALSRVESDCGPAWLARVRVYAGSTAAGRNEAWDAMDAIASALEGRTLTLASPAAQAQVAYVILAGDVIDPINPKLVYADISAVVSDQ